MANDNFFIKLFRAIGRGLRRLSQAIRTLLFLAFLVVVLATFLGRGVQVPDSAVLVLAPSGVLVEQLAGDPLERALAEIQGAALRQTLVADLTDSLEAAADDERIKAVLLSLDDFDGGGVAKLQAVAAALAAFRATGKPVIAMANGYSQAQYFLAAQADEVYLHPLGMVLIEGFGYYRAFFRDALDKLSIDVNVFRVGEYKSFVEPFTRDDMSAEDKQASQRWLEALWQTYLGEVAAGRELEPQAVQAYATELADRVEAARGDMGQAALQAGLVDELVDRRAVESRLIELAGESDVEQGRFSGIGHRAYLEAVRSQAPPEAGVRNVGVLVAAGEIVDGEAGPGTIGGDTLAALVRQAAEDESVSAVVLRVDSPGGSMFASEVVFAELTALKDRGKPLVVSMGSLAASGGYYIAMPADEIWAAPSTITGSIGVGALVPTFHRSLERLGVRIDGIGTTPLAGQLDPTRELGPDAQRILQATVDDAYRVFVTKVAASREMSYERADNLARGRVWIGTDALELGLVDALGSFDDAIGSAAALAGLGEDEYGIKPIERELGLREQLFIQLAAGAETVARGLRLDGLLGIRPLVRRIAWSLERELQMLERLNDPRGIYYHCFCQLP